jgi:uncharacterized protein YbjT (DUF2867 family)
MSQLNICILGGTGQVGRAIASRLARDTRHRVRVVSRRRERNRDMLVLPNLTMVEANPIGLGELRTVLQGQDVVINLIAVLNETGREKQGFEEIHVELPRRIAHVCEQLGIHRVLHVSALHAAENGPSEYLRSKARGEQAMHEAGGDALRVTTFRPSVIFGPRDGFTNRFAGLLRQIPFLLPLACPDAKFQPIWVEDVARAMVASIDRRQTFGQRYNLCGPRVYTLHEIVSWIARVTGHRRHILRLSDGQSRLQARVLEKLPGRLFTLDNYHSLQVDSVCDAGFPEVFGIEPRSMEEIAPAWLAPHRDPLDGYRREAGRA